MNDEHIRINIMKRFEELFETGDGVYIAEQFKEKRFDIYSEVMRDLAGEYDITGYDTPKVFTKTPYHEWADRYIRFFGLDTPNEFDSLKVHYEELNHYIEVLAMYKDELEFLIVENGYESEDNELYEHADEIAIHLNNVYDVELIKGIIRETAEYYEDTKDMKEYQTVEINVKGLNADFEDIAIDLYDQATGYGDLKGYVNRFGLEEMVFRGYVDFTIDVSDDDDPEDIEDLEAEYEYEKG